MNHVYAFLFLIASLFLSACQTTAQKQFSNVQSKAQAAYADVDACYERLKNKPGYVSTKELGIFVADPQHPEKLRRYQIDRFLTEDERETVLINHAFSSECRVFAIERWSKISPSAAENLVVHYNNLDNIIFELLNEDINIGEFNRQQVDAIMEAKRRHEQIGTKMAQELEYAHQNQVKNRQNFSKAFTESMQTYNAQQQRIRERRDYMRSLDRVINKPTTTTCNTMGNTLTCNTN